MTRAVRRRLLGVALVVMLPALGPASADAAQSIGEGCEFEDGSELFERQSFGTSTQLFVLRARIRCEGGVTLRADSLRYNSGNGRADLIGNVFYADSVRSLTAASAEYFRDARRLNARGDSTRSVEVTELRDGGRLAGQNLIYNQQGGGRAEDEVTVFGARPDGTRPKATLPVDPPTDAEPDAPEPTPFDVTADRIFLRGEDFFEATGGVDLLRDSLVTRSDTLVYDEVTTTLDLRGRASLVQGLDSIRGRRVRVRLPENEIREIEAIGEGSLVSRDLDLESPWYRVTFVEGEVDGLWAAPLRRTRQPTPDSTAAPEPGADEPPEPVAEREMEAGDEGAGLTPRDSLDALQPVARSGDTRISADSLDVTASVGVLDSVRAMGRAYAVSRRDSLDASMLPEIAQDDWIRGDTIVASFLSIEEGDSTVYAVDRIVADGNASSLYRLAPDPAAADDSTAVEDPEVDPEVDPDVDPPLDTLPAVADSIPGEVPDAGAEPVVILPSDAPGVHYVVAERIILIFEDDEVRRMEIFGLVEGLHLEPRRGSATATTAVEPPGGRP